MSPKVTLRVVLLFAASIASAHAESYSKALEKGQTVSRIVRLYAGKASLWKNKGVQVESGKTGRKYLKNNASYRRLAVGDVVTIDASLVPTHTLAVSGQPLQKVCVSFSTARCEERLRLVNRLAPPDLVPSAIKVPNFFLQVSPVALPVPIAPSPVPQQSPKPETRQVVRWRVILLVALFLAALLALLLLIFPDERFAGFYKRLPKTEGKFYRYRPYVLAKELRERLAAVEEGLLDRSIWIIPQACSLNIFASDRHEPLVLNILDAILTGDTAYGRHQVDSLHAVQIFVNMPQRRN